MTPERAFKSGGRNPNSGLWVRQWYASGCIFTPQGVLHEGEVILGLRQITAIDMASHYCMGFDAPPEEPNALRAAQLIPFMNRICQKFGKPSQGWVISHSCWLSSLEMALDDDTADQGRFLQDNEIEFGPMAEFDKQKLREWGNENSIHILFDADQIPQKG